MSINPVNSLTPPQRRSLRGLTQLEKNRRIEGYLRQNGYSTSLNQINRNVVNYAAGSRRRTSQLPPRRLNFNNSRFLQQNSRSQISSAPMTSGTSFSTQLTTEIVVDKSAFAGDFNQSGTSTGFDIEVIDVHPYLIQWMKDMSNLFTRWKPVLVQWRYVSFSPTTSVGLFFTAFQARSTKHLPTTFKSVQSFEMFTAGPLWQTSEWLTMPSRLTDRVFLIQRAGSSPNEDAAVDIIPGRILYGVNGNAGAKGSYGVLELRMKIIFSDPESGSENLIGREPTDSSSIVEVTL